MVSEYEKTLEEAYELSNKNEHQDASELFYEATKYAECEREYEIARAHACMEEARHIGFSDAVKAASCFRQAANIFHNRGKDELREEAIDELITLKDSVALYEKAEIQAELLKVEDLPNYDVESGFYHKYLGISHAKNDNFRWAIDNFKRSVEIFSRFTEADKSLNRQALKTKGELHKCKGYMKMRNYKFQIARQMFKDAMDFFSKVGVDEEVGWCRAWKNISTFFLTQNHSHLEDVEEVLPHPDGNMGDGFKKGVVTYIHSVKQQGDPS